MSSPILSPDSLYFKNCKFCNLNLLSTWIHALRIDDRLWIFLAKDYFLESLYFKTRSKIYRYIKTKPTNDCRYWEGKFQIGNPVNIGRCYYGDFKYLYNYNASCGCIVNTFPQSLYFIPLIHFYNYILFKIVEAISRHPREYRELCAHICNWDAVQFFADIYFFIWKKTQMVSHFSS